MPNITLGTNIFRGKHTPILYQDQDRLRHLYMIGKTGVGKTSVFQNMALQDIRNFHGVCYIDPHGDSIEWLLQRIPEGRLEDVILFDPSDQNFPFGLNILEARDERERDFLVAECISIFYKLFDPQKSGVVGPQFEHWLRNAALTVMAGPDGGSIVEIPKLFIDKKFEQHKRKYVTDPIVQDFWGKQMAKTSDYHRSEMLNYFTSKFGHFMSNSLMRNIIGQHSNSLDFDKIISGEKILLVNLSKGKIGDLNAQMLGLVLVAKLQAAILKRAEIEEAKRYPFYLYVDEFQNVVTDSFTSMLSESRKYGLGVHLANQYFAQLPEATQQAILGNVGSMIAFAVGTEDAELMAKEFPSFTKDDFLNLDKFNFYIKLMINGKTSEGFSALSLPPEKLLTQDWSARIRTINQLAYAIPKELAETEIQYQIS